MKLFTAILLFPLLLLAGCVGGTSSCRVTPTDPGDAAEMDGRPVIGRVTAENRGVFLFGSVPLWTGNPTNPNRRDYKTFRNYLLEGYQMLMLENAAEKKDADLAVIHHDSYSTGIYTLWIVVSRKYTSHALLLGRGKRGK